ncbi:hypothetical protein VYU27_007470 [Nannochloropsis oceanica]
MTRHLHVQLCGKRQQTTFVSTSFLSSASGLHLLPPLRLSDATPTVALSAASSPFLHALATTPFWMDVTLSYLLLEDWLLLESLSHSLGPHIASADAWRDIDLGPAFLSSLPPDLSTPQVIQRIRREIIDRQKSLRRMRKAWAGLKKFADRDVAWTFNPGLEEDMVRRLEDKMGCVLPPDLRASFLIHDGQGFLSNSGIIVGGGRLLSLSEVVAEACRQDREEWKGREGEENRSNAKVLAPPALRFGEEGVEGSRARMVPVSEGARGRSLCVALPRRRRRAGEETEKGNLGEEDDVGCVYIVTALSCQKMARSWGEYMGCLR